MCPAPEYEGSSWTWKLTAYVRGQRGNTDKPFLAQEVQLVERRTRTVTHGGSIPGVNTLIPLQEARIKGRKIIHSLRNCPAAASRILLQQTFTG